MVRRYIEYPVLFHSFCYDGPLFKQEVKIKVTEVIERTYDLNKEEGTKVKQKVRNTGKREKKKRILKLKTN